MVWDRSAHRDRSPVWSRIETMLSRVGPLVFALAFIIAFHVAPAAAQAGFARDGFAQAGFKRGAHIAQVHGAQAHGGQVLTSVQIDGAARVIETIRRMPRTYAVRTTDTQFAMAAGKPAISAEIVANLSLAAAPVRLADARGMGAPVRAPPMTMCIL
ncbi:MAG TPA: hypothetical protein VGN05_10645 [Parvibaculum sp.]